MFYDFPEEENEIDRKALETAKKNTIVKNANDWKSEVWEVMQLKVDPEYFSKPSPVIDKLYEDRKQRHEFLLSKLGEDLNDVNLEIENNIRISSQEIKDRINSNKEKLDEILNTINIPEVASYHGSVFVKIQLQANQMKIKQKNSIEELYQDLLKYENTRSVKNEKILHSASEELRKNGYILPYELQSFIEQETLKMNQLILNNRRCYEDLRLQLTLATEETFKTFTDKMFCIQEKWVRHKTLEVCQQMIEEAEDKAAKVMPEPYKRLELKGNELLTRLMPDGLYTTCEVESWLSNVNSVVGTIEKYGTTLIDMYRKMLDAIFLNFDLQVKDIRKELNMLENFEIQETIIQPIIFQAQNEEISNIEELEAFWQKTLNEIRLVIKDVVEFLYDIGKVWDNHNERMMESQKLILASLENKIESNRIELQDVEIKLNTALDNLRQEYEKNKMDQLFQSVIVILNDIKSKLEDNYLDEISLIEEFYNVLNSEAEVLSSELQELIYSLHPLPPYDEMDSVDNVFDKKYVYMEIKLCAVHIKKITSWKKGVWKAIEGFSQNTKDCLAKRAESWINLKIREMSEKMEIQMEIHCRRYERIKTEMYDTRIKEINQHELVFDEHKAKIEDTYNVLKDNLQTLTEKESIKLNELKEIFDSYEEKINVDSRAAVVESIKIQMGKRKTDLEEKIKMAHVGLLSECETVILTIRSRNIDFMKGIRLFSEGGNYHDEEIKLYMGRLEAIDINAEAELKNIETECNQKQNDILEKINDLTKGYFERVSYISDELQFFNEISSEMSKLVKIIKNYAVHFILEFNLLKKQCEEPTEITGHFNTGSVTYEDRLLFCLIKNLYKNISNIFYPINLPEDFETQDENESEAEAITCGLSDLSARATIASNEAIHGFEKNEIFTCKDYKPKLFKTNNPPENNFTFMAIISNKLWSFMDDLQYLGCIFYCRKMKGRTISRSDLLWPNYDTFAEYILSKFQCYNLQCEQLWLKIIHEFLPMLCQLKKTINICIEKKIRNSEKSSIEAITREHEEFIIQANDYLEKTELELRRLEERLLPLHGHPNNQSLLEQLQEHVICKTSKLSVDWETAVASYKARLNALENHYLIDKTDMQIVADFSLKFRNALFADSLGSRLLNEISKYVKRGGYYAKRNSTKNLKPPAAPPTTPVENESTEIPSSCDLNINLSGTKTERLQVLLLELENLLRTKDNNSECSKSDVSGNMSLNLLIEPASCDEMIKESLRTIDNMLQELYLVADSKKLAHDEILFKWLDTWKLNVKKILKLYVVKYSEPEPPSGKYSFRNYF